MTAHCWHGPAHRRAVRPLEAPRLPPHCREDVGEFGRPVRLWRRQLWPRRVRSAKASLRRWRAQEPSSLPTPFTDTPSTPASQARFVITRTDGSTSVRNEDPTITPAVARRTALQRYPYFCNETQ